MKKNNNTKMSGRYRERSEKMVCFFVFFLNKYLPYARHSISTLSPIFGTAGKDCGNLSWISGPNERAAGVKEKRNYF